VLEVLRRTGLLPVHRAESLSHSRLHQRGGRLLARKRTIEKDFEDLDEKFVGAHLRRAQLAHQRIVRSPQGIRTGMNGLLTNKDLALLIATRAPGISRELRR
jgi:hypothetical protein